MSGARALERLGTRGVLGVGLLVFCAAFYLGALRPAEQRLAELEPRALRLEAGRAALLEGAAPRLEEELSRFYAQLAPAQAMGALAERVFALGAKYGVTLRQGGYRSAGEEGAPFVRYEFTYQASAPYYRVRLFLRQVLREMPMVALEDVSFQRPSAGTPVTEVNLKLSFLVRRP